MRVCEYCDDRPARWYVCPKTGATKLTRTCSAECGEALRVENSKFGKRLSFDSWAGWAWNQAGADCVPYGPQFRSSCDALVGHIRLFGERDGDEMAAEFMRAYIRLGKVKAAARRVGIGATTGRRVLTMAAAA
jgi:hypothetical protein